MSTTVAIHGKFNSIFLKAQSSFLVTEKEITGSAFHYVDKTRQFTDLELNSVLLKVLLCHRKLEFIFENPFQDLRDTIHRAQI